MAHERDRAADVYRRLLEERRSELSLWQRRERRVANLRLAVFVAGVAWLGLALWLPDLSGLWVLPLVALFVALVMRHDTARRSRLRAERAVAWFERALERLDYRYAGRGRSGERFLDDTHPYAVHLDLFGRGSLFELLSLSQTQAGEETLASWLLQPAPPDEIAARQAAVEELRPRVDLREDLAVLGPEVVPDLRPQKLADWGAEPARLPVPVALRVAAFALPVLTLACAVAGLAGSGILPFGGALLVQTGFAGVLRARVRAVVRGAERPAQQLELLVALLGRVERERFAAPRLVELRSALDTGGQPPSRQAARLARLVTLLDSRRNQLFALLAPFLLWTTQLAFALEAWRLRCGPHLGEWIETVGELEALCDLAGYAFEHPADPFPDIDDSGPRFLADGLGHPLMPEEVCVPNDVCLDADLALLVVSGSNMSGKSTLLRSIGTNVVLAQAGAPVRAGRLRLSPLALGASLRILDSLQEGTSRFYAEITCLKRIVSLADAERPLLFLLDEILQGTNSHDRRIGATEVVRGLIGRGAIGLITTHDLALAEIAEAVGERGKNVHFEDQLVDGRMSFDHRLRDGVVTRSNALALMRAVGLDV